MSSDEEPISDKADMSRTEFRATQNDEERRASLPSKSENVRIPGVLAVVSWVDPDGQEQFLDTRTEMLIQYCTSPVNTLFIRLQFEISQPSRRGHKHLYVFLRPHQIQSLAVLGDQDASPSTTLFVKKALGSDDAYRLSVTTHELGALVIPKGLDPGAFSPDAQQVVSLMESLKSGPLSHKSFNLRFARHCIPEGSLLELCRAASTPGLLKSDARLDDLNSLYGGRGGQAIALDFQVATLDVDSPPSYEAAHANASGESLSLDKARPRNKRRRREAPSASDTSVPADPDVSPATLKLLTDQIDNFIDARIDQRLKSYTDDAINARINNNLVSHIDKIIDERVGTRIDAAVERFLAPIESRLTTIQSSIESSKKEFEDLRYDLERDIKDLREETEDVLSTRFDEEISEAKEDIHDYARAQIEDAKKDIIKRLREEPLKCVVNMEFDAT
ncbi:unnamed protein product [Clonostachys rosea]|uniref:Uncharacterized protein n=1 Tax=Bionectria ochroleuca TaxID=29856 RepID=A0ABY6UFW4_BIOOC|nr:unnamed protein product [Clonostachys rosea]